MKFTQALPDRFPVIHSVMLQKLQSKTTRLYDNKIEGGGGGRTNTKVVPQVPRSEWAISTHVGPLPDKIYWE